MSDTPYEKIHNIARIGTVAGLILVAWILYTFYRHEIAAEPVREMRSLSLYCVEEARFPLERAVRDFKREHGVVFVFEYGSGAELEQKLKQGSAAGESLLDLYIAFELKHEALSAERVDLARVGQALTTKLRSTRQSDALKTKHPMLRAYLLQSSVQSELALEFAHYLASKRKARLYFKPYGFTSIDEDTQR